MREGWPQRSAKGARIGRDGGGRRAGAEGFEQQETELMLDAKKSECEGASMEPGDNDPAVATLPDNLELSVALTRAELTEQVRLMASLKMFELGKLSSGRAAELAGLSRAAFFDACGRYRVSLFNYDSEELERELKADLEGQAASEKA